MTLGDATNLEAPDRPVGARSGIIIGLAFLTASALGFVLLGVLARWLTPEQNAQFLALWGLVFGIGSALSAVEQEIVRLATNAHIDRVRVPARALQVTGLAVLVAIGAIAVIGVLPGVSQFLSDSLLVSLLVLMATGGFAVQSMSRAVLLGTNQVPAYVLVVVVEAALRLALVTAFVVGGVTPTLGLATLVIVVGSFGWVPVIHRVASRLSWTKERSSMRSVGATVGALGLANGLQSLQVTALPTLASAILGASASTAPLFGAVTMARLPLVALAPVQAMAVPVATRLIRERRHGDLVSLVARLSIGGLACAAVALVAGWFLGPWALTVYMGADYVIAPGVVAVLLGASCVLAVALLEVAALIALERYWTAVLVWLLAAVALVLCMTALSLAPDERAAVGIAVGAVVSWVLATFAVIRDARRRAEAQLTPAS